MKNQEIANKLRGEAARNFKNANELAKKEYRQIDDVYRELVLRITAQCLLESAHDLE